MADGSYDTCWICGSEVDKAPEEAQAESICDDCLSIYPEPLITCFQQGEGSYLVSLHTGERFTFESISLQGDWVGLAGKGLPAKDGLSNLKPALGLLVIWVRVADILWCVDLST